MADRIVRRDCPRSWRGSHSYPAPATGSVYREQHPGWPDSRAGVSPSLLRWREFSLSSLRGRRGPGRGGPSCLRLALVSAVVTAAELRIPSESTVGREAPLGAPCLYL